MPASVGVAVKAATGADMMNYDPWTAGVIASEFASAATGYAYDAMTKESRPEAYEPSVEEETQYLIAEYSSNEEIMGQHCSY